MCRDIGLSLGGSGQRPGCFVLVAPVGFVGLDEVAAEDLAGGEVGDGDVVVVGEREDAFAGVFGADAEVVHPACSAEAHLAGVVEPVVAQPVVGLGACPLLAGSAFGVAR